MANVRCPPATWVWGGQQPQLRIEAEVVDINGEVFAALNGTMKLGEGNAQGLPPDQVFSLDADRRALLDTRAGFLKFLRQQLH